MTDAGDIIPKRYSRGGRLESAEASGRKNEGRINKKQPKFLPANAAEDCAKRIHDNSPFRSLYSKATKPLRRTHTSALLKPLRSFSIYI